MKVSVCMITYKHENYVREAIESILMQKTNFDFELIIANDHSPDGTDEVIRSIIASHPKGNCIRYFLHPSNLRIMPNFIFALKECSGEYIALCEGDDYWTDENKLQKQIDFLDNNKDYSGCFHNVIMINEMIPNFKPQPWRVYEKNDFELKDTFSKTALFHTCSFVFRKEFLQIPDWFEKVLSGDRALFSLVASKGRLKRIEGEMGVYRKNENGVTSTLSLKNYHKKNIELFRFFKTHFSNSYQNELNKMINYHRYEYLKLYVSKALKFLKLK